MKPIEREATGRTIYWLAAVRADLESLSDPEGMKALGVTPESIISNALRCLTNADNLVEGMALGTTEAAVIAENLRERARATSSA